jgi:Na+/proline symporter
VVKALERIKQNKIASSSRAITRKMNQRGREKLAREIDDRKFVARVMTTIASARAKAFLIIETFIDTCFFHSISVYLPIVVYIPSLAFNQVTGVNVHVTTWFVVIICVFYTCVGGLKAVVWTDVVQTFSMFGALVLVAVKGTMDLKDGGVGVVISNALNTSRLEAPM